MARYVIDGCLEVLAHDGYRHASLSRITQVAGLSKGLVLRRSD